MKYSITVLTPLYNRGEYLEAIFNCLASQERSDIQWLIIDDGSDERSDDTVLGLSKKADFLIEYHYKENGGKHTALNFAHPHVKSDWVLILDSDDTLTDDALATALPYLERYGGDDTVGVVSFQKGQDKETSQVEFSNEEVLSDHISYRINAGREGDCCEIIKTKALREFPFPEYEGERYIAEGYLWLKCAEKYKTLYVPRVIYLCEYLEDGLTASGRSFWRKSPLGCFECHKAGLIRRCSVKYRAKRALLLHYYGRVAGMKNREICQRSGHPLFLSLFTLPGIILHAYWEKKYA